MATKSSEAKIKFTAETSDFNAAIEKTKTQIRGLYSEVKLVDSQMDNSGESTDSLKKKHNLLQEELEKTKEKEDLLNQKLQKAIEIFGENSTEAQKWSSELTKAKTAEEKIKTAISECNTKIEQNEAAMADSQTASSMLTKEIESQESELKSLKAEYVNVTLEQGNTSTEAKNLASKITDLNSSLEENKDKLSDAEKGADNLTDAVDDAGDSATSASNGGFTVFKGMLADLAANAITECVQGIKELASSVVSTGMSFESSLSKVEALSGATADEMEQLKTKAEEMGESTTFTSSEVADGFSYMALAGWDTSEMIEGISGILDLAAASEMDLATASDIVTDNLSAFGLTAADSTQLANQMAYAMSNSNTSTEQLGEAWKNSAATSTQLGYSLEDTTAALMVMADSGIKGGEAGTALSSIMTRLGNNVSNCRDTLSEYGVEVYDSEGNVNSLSDILQGCRDVWSGLTDEQKSNLSYVVAGKTAQSELMTVLGDTTGSFAEYSAGLSECSNTTSEASDMSETMLDNLSGDVTLMQSEFDGLKTSIFDDVDEPLRDVVQGITNDLIPAASEMYENIKTGIEWMKEHKTMMGLIGIGLGTLTGLLTANAIVTGVKTAMDAAQTTTLLGLAAAQLGLNTAFLSCPITWFVALLVGAAAGFVYLWNTCDSFRQFWIDLWDGITSFFSDAKDTIATGIDNIGGFFTSIPDKINGGVEGFKTKVSEGFGAAYSNLDELTNGGLSAVVSMTQNSLSDMKSAYDEAGGGIKGIAAATMEGYKSAFTNGYNAVDTLTGGKLTSVLNTTKANLNSMKSAYDDAGGGIQGIVAGMMEGQKIAFTNGFNAIDTLTGGKLSALANTVSEKMNSIHEFFSGIIEKIKSVFNFSFTWPEIKSPYVDVEWKTDGVLAKAAQMLGLEGVPDFKVKWHADGAVLTQPTIFGMAGGQLQGAGEAGPEAILPVSILEEYITNSMMQFISAIPQIDYAQLGESVASALRENPTKLVIGEREFGRVISDLS